MSKAVVYRALARDDIEAAAVFYAERDHQAAARFIDSLDDAARHISHYPLAGSQRYGDLLSIPELRQHNLKRFPYIIFYIEKPSHIEVYRVLSTNTDIFHTLDRAPEK